MKFNFKADFVVEASSEEAALKLITHSLGIIARYVGSGANLEDTDPPFQLIKIADDVEHHDLHGKFVGAAGAPAAITEQLGVIPLNLDPKSPRGIAYVKQVEREEVEAAAREKAEAEAKPETAKAE